MWMILLSTSSVTQHFVVTKKPTIRDNTNQFGLERAARDLIPGFAGPSPKEKGRF